MKSRILVVDDESAIRESMRMILEYEGHECQVAANGPDALTEIEREAPDLVFLDIKMPGMDGLEVLGRIRTLSERPLRQADVYRMVRRRAKDAGIATPIGCHTFRATGITNYLENGGTLEKAQSMAAHESARTTGLYDRRGDEVTLDEVERIAI